MNKSINPYDDFEKILDNVRTIIRTNAPENSVLLLIKEINKLEDEIKSTKDTELATWRGFNYERRYEEAKEYEEEYHQNMLQLDLEK